MPQKSRARLKAMDLLKDIGFYQRLWSKRKLDADNNPRLIGKPPPYRDGTIPGDDDELEMRLINAEALVPPYAPNLYGDEGIKGTETDPGWDKPDYVSRDTLLGNPDADYDCTVPVPDVPPELNGQTKSIVEWFNSKSPDPEDHIDRIENTSSLGNKSFEYKRPETPNEVRQRLEKADKKAWDRNSYHSAILRDPNNIRRVVAMDVAIGQARSLDDPETRELLIAIADWKLDMQTLNDLTKGACYQRLDATSQALITQSAGYYWKGIFPSALVPTTPPKMVDAETFRDREKRQ
jgi:hypothetical protein